jgi:hypothetical protein
MRAFAVYERANARICCLRIDKCAHLQFRTFVVTDIFEKYNTQVYNYVKLYTYLFY